MWSAVVKSKGGNQCEEQCESEGNCVGGCVSDCEAMEASELLQGRNCGRCGLGNKKSRTGEVRDFFIF